MNLADKVVLVTGAGSGIGRATALAFAAERARVIACDVDQARLDELAGRLGERALLVRRVDVADRAQMAAFADAVHAAVPAVDVLVNNAGVAVGGSFLDTSLDNWDWLLGINLKGVVHGCHFFLPRMVERGEGGHVVNISSILGIFAPANASAYAASKFAVLGLSRSLRAELAPKKIGVTAICPGMIATAIVDGARLSDKLAPTMGRIQTAFKKGASPDVVARSILDSVRRNHAVRTVGADAWAISAITRIAPRASVAISSLISRRLDG